MTANDVLATLRRDGLVAVVKADCPTCTLIRPLLDTIDVLVVSEDDAEGLDTSYHLGVETVPTLLRVADGREVERIVGWSRAEWRSFTGDDALGDGLPEYRPGCGSKTLDAGVAGELAVRFSAGRMRSRRVELAGLEDEIEAMFDRGWTDGLPVVPPTELRVLQMLAGTTSEPDEVVTIVPPDLVECTVEKVAINAVLAGCKPEYMPVVLAAIEAVCTEEFNGHGLLATTYFSGPVIVVNGPIARAIGMNSGINALGQGNRANATIGRAVQLIIRNVGGGRPGEVDRATLGNPGKYTFCFAEDELGSPFEPLSVARGAAEGASAVTLFAGSGVQGMVDQISRTPESLASSLAECLRVVGHPKLPLAFDAMVVLSPEHGRVFRDAGWSRGRLTAELLDRLQLAGADIVRGAHGIDEGVPESLRGATLPKFRDGGLLICAAGGGAGLFSAIIGGWASGSTGSTPVTWEVRT